MAQAQYQPLPATQAQVNAGTNTTRFVTPLTFASATIFSQKSGTNLTLVETLSATGSGLGGYTDGSYVWDSSSKYTNTVNGNYITNISTRWELYAAVYGSNVYYSTTFNPSGTWAAYASAPAPTVTALGGGSISAGVVRGRAFAGDGSLLTGISSGSSGIATNGGSGYYNLFTNLNVSPAGGSNSLIYSAGANGQGTYRESFSILQFSNAQSSVTSDPHPDHQTVIGYNLGGSSAVINTNQPALGISYEDNWANYAAIIQSEFYLSYTFPYTNYNIRPFGFNFTRATNTVAASVNPSVDGHIYADSFGFANFYPAASDAITFTMTRGASPAAVMSLYGDINLSSNAVTPGSISMGKGGGLTIKGSGASDTNTALINIDASKVLAIDASAANAIKFVAGGVNPSFTIGDQAKANTANFYCSAINLNTNTSGASQSPTLAAKDGGYLKVYNPGNSKSASFCINGNEWNNNEASISTSGAFPLVFWNANEWRFLLNPGSGKVNIKSYTTQTGNMLELQNSSSTVLSGVNSNGVYFSTAGYSSTANSATNTIAATGYTNTSSINRGAYLTATSISFNINNSTNRVDYTSPVLTTTIYVHLKPGESITAAGGLAGTVRDE